MHYRILLLAIVSLALIGCNESLPVAPEAELNPGPVLAAKPDCNVDPSHPSCSDTGDGGTFVPVTFPATLDGGGANGMIDPGGQTLKVGNTSKIIGGFNPSYVVQMNFGDSFAAGVAACVADSRGGFSPAEQEALLGLLTDGALERYTIVNIARKGLGSENRDHKIEATWGDGLAVNLRQSPHVEKVVEGSGDSGTYRFTGGTLEIRDFTLSGRNFHALDCPNLDAVDVAFDFTSP